MSTMALVLAQQQPPELDAGLMAGVIAALSAVMVPLVIVLVIMIVAQWKIFTKAGQPGWASIIPIYNNFVLDEIIGKPAWWIVLWLIPCTAPFVAIIACLELAKVFGKGAGFGVGLILLPMIFFPILAFSDAQYRKPIPAMA